MFLFDDRTVPDLRTDLPGPKAGELLLRDAEFVSPSYTRAYPLVVERGSVAAIEDVDGNLFLDFTAGIALTIRKARNAAPAPEITPTANAIRLKGYWRPGEGNPRGSNLIFDLLKKLRENPQHLKFTATSTDAKTKKSETVDLKDDQLVKQLGLPDSVVVARDIVETGNTSAASIPLATERLLAEGQVRSGDLALQIGFGAGLVYAAQVVVLP